VQFVANLNNYNFYTMKTKIHFKLDQDCQADWGAMSATEQGRFCGLCQKKVVDFSVMTDEAIVAFLDNPTNWRSTCGQFTNQQLEDGVQIPKKMQQKAWQRAAAILIVGLTATGAPLTMYAQNVVPTDTIAPAHQDEYETIMEDVLLKPETTKSVIIPAEYQDIEKQIMLTPEQIRIITVPAEYKTVTYKKLTRKGGFVEWKKVDCGKITPNDLINQVKIADIQMVLKKNGLYKGKIDNKKGAKTEAAIIAFRKQNYLGEDATLDYHTLNMLGLL
jgi:Putative peptidoglycan binding domain